jgi:glycosyltransferase involved in cell wall biosynthesis
MKARRAARGRDGKPKVLHVTMVALSLDKLLGAQLRGFRDAGFEVVTASAPGPEVAGLEAEAIRHVPLHRATRSWNLRADLAAARELWRVVRAERPDVLHLHTPKPGAYGRPIGRLARVPLVVNTVHGLFAQEDDRLTKRVACYAIERAAACFSDVELVQSIEDVAVLRRLRVPARKVVHLGNGIDLAAFDPSAIDPDERIRIRRELGGHDERIVVGCVARLVREKGIEELVAAFEQLRSEGVPVHLVLIGERSGERDAVDPAVLDRARAAGASLLGRRDDVPRLLAGMDVHVLPSYREGYPRVVMEAAAMGVPSVATDIRGCREAVVDGVTGLLYPRGDVAALTTLLRDLVADPGRRRSLGEEARRRGGVEFDHRRQVAITLEAYARRR